MRVYSRLLSRAGVIFTGEPRYNASDVKFAKTHPEFVPVARLSWNEDAVAKFEGRPVTSHHADPLIRTALSAYFVTVD